MTELAQLQVEGAGPVAALTFTPDGQELLVVHGKEGSLRRWRVASGTLATVFDVGPVGMAAVSFDGEARLLAVGAGHTPPAVQAGYDAPVQGVRIWDTITGHLIHEIDVDLKFRTQWSDIALSPKGDRLLCVDPGILEAWNVVTGEHETAVVLLTGENMPPGWAAIRVVAFDHAGEWLAWATESGDVEVESWDSKVSGVQSGPRPAPNSSPGMPLALAIDPSRRWLAEITDTSLYVWDIQRWFNREALRTEVAAGPLAALAFSPDGALLAVGTAGGWQIWSVGDWKLLAQGPKQATYAVTFSPDGRLLAWGNVDGVVHLWGVQ